MSAEPTAQTPQQPAAEPLHAHQPGPRWLEYLRVWRIDHWLKNVFILFGHAVAVALLPGFMLRLFPLGEPGGGVLGLGRVADWGEIIPLGVTILFSLVPACLVASANYILNEILDAPFDRQHPTKRFRAVPSGTVRIPVLWLHMAALLMVAFGLSFAFFNLGYTISLALLALSGLVYNVQPVRLKDRAFLDVIAESFNNPIRLWLGWYAIAPWNSLPPLSLVLAWWFFGALLMAGKRYAEFRFIDDAARSGQYRRSFRVYTEKTLIISMITYANLFCFCMGAAITHYKPNLIFVFPVIVLAVIIYFYHAMSAKAARLEPEQLMRNPWIILATAATIIIGTVLVILPQDLPDRLQFFQLIPGSSSTATGGDG